MPLGSRASLLSVTTTPRSRSDGAPRSRMSTALSGSSVSSADRLKSPSMRPGARTHAARTADAPRGSQREGLTRAGRVRRPRGRSRFCRPERHGRVRRAGPRRRARPARPAPRGSPRTRHGDHSATPSDGSRSSATAAGAHSGRALTRRSRRPARRAASACRRPVDQRQLAERGLGREPHADAARRRRGPAHAPCQQRARAGEHGHLAVGAAQRQRARRLVRRQRGAVRARRRSPGAARARRTPARGRRRRRTAAGCPAARPRSDSRGDPVPRRN